MFREFLSAPEELFSPKEAAHIARRGAQTIRLWAGRYKLGVNIAGRWMVNRIALRLFVEGENEALQLFRGGDRAHPTILRAYASEGLSLPKQTSEAA